MSEQTKFKPHEFRIVHQEDGEWMRAFHPCESEETARTVIDELGDKSLKYRIVKVTYEFLP